MNYNYNVMPILVGYFKIHTFTWNARNLHWTKTSTVHACLCKLLNNTEH